MDQIEIYIDKVLSIEPEELIEKLGPAGPAILGMCDGDPEKLKGLIVLMLGVGLPMFRRFREALASESEFTITPEEMASINSMSGMAPQFSKYSKLLNL
jgi:hypothetical protein